MSDSCRFTLTSEKIKECLTAAESSIRTDGDRGLACGMLEAVAAALASYARKIGSKMEIVTCNASHVAELEHRRSELIRAEIDAHTARRKAESEGRPAQTASHSVATASHGKKLSMSAFNQMDPAERMDFIKSGGKLID